MFRVKVPASTSNLGSGFDTFGLALNLYLAVTAHRSPDVTRISYSGENSEVIPTDKSNLVWRALQALFEHVEQPVPALSLAIQNPIPVARGLGSSGAAIVAGLFAGNLVAGGIVSPEEILRLAGELEGHPENVSASLLGGMTISCSAGATDLTRRAELKVPPHLTVLVPEIQVSTADARASLPQLVSHGEAVFNVQRSALLSYAFQTGEYDILPEAMLDKLHQPFRKQFIPDYDAFEKAAYNAGAAGVCISGSGSAIVAFTAHRQPKIEQSWRALAARQSWQSRILTLETSAAGAQEIGHEQ